MQFRCLLEFLLVLLYTGDLSRVSPNAELHIPVILGSSKDISFIECTSTIKKEGGLENRIDSFITHNSTSLKTAFSYYFVDTAEFTCVPFAKYMTVCYKEDSNINAAIATRTYLTNTPKEFRYTCEAQFRFTNGNTKTLMVEKNILEDERFASSGIRCQGHGWCNNQPGSATYSSNKHCCNSALCHASRSGEWHDPVCCFYIARKQVPSDITTRMVITKQTYFLALSLLVVFTMCSGILGTLQMIAMGKERRKQWKLLEARKRRGRLDDLKAVQRLRSLLQEQKENEPLLTVN